MRWPGSRAALALALLFLAACEGTDYSGALTLEVDSAAPVAAGTWDIASLGRLAVDWRVDNDGSTPAQVDLRAVATTSGAVHDAACEAMLGRARSLDAADGSGEGAFDAPSGTIPVVSDLEQPFRVDLAGDGTRPSWIRVRLPRAGTYRLVNDAGIAMAVVATGTSRPLTPLRTVLTPVCSTVSSLLEIALLDVDYLVRFAPSARGSLVFLVEEDCESARDVGRTCAGSGGTVASETFADLAWPDVRRRWVLRRHRVRMRRRLACRAIERSGAGRSRVPRAPPAPGRRARVHGVRGPGARGARACG